ncbi:MAG: hypothetical protein AAB899_04920 [Patescibacteria group bacterium]
MVLQDSLTNYLKPNEAVWVDSGEDAMEELDGGRPYDRIIILAGYQLGLRAVKLLNLIRCESRFNWLPVIFVEHYVKEVADVVLYDGGIFADEGKLPDSLDEALRLADEWRHSGI